MNNVRDELGFTVGGVLVLLLFLAMSNTLFSLPIDKVAFVLFCFLFSILVPGKIFFSGQVVPFASMFCVFLLSYLLSLNDFVVHNFDSFLIVFYLFCLLFLVSKVYCGFAVFIKISACAIFPYVLFGVISWFYSVYAGEVFFVKPLYGKQMSDVYGALSFATTQQVFATFCILGMISIVYLNRIGWVGRCSTFFYVAICVVGVFVSLNRVWLVFLPVFFLFWGGRKVLYAFFFVGVVSILAFFLYSDVMLSFETVESRLMMMDRTLIFVSGQDLSSLLFGDPFYMGDYFFMHGRYFSYIENGQFYLISKFGFVGFFWFLIMSILWVVYLFRVSFFLAVFSIYYLFFVQFMTQEYFSLSFWIYWLLIIAWVRIEGRLLSGEGYEKNSIRASF